ncbi:hypothetical protein [Nocardioides sp. TF02-7]|uniref:hypothetical protein n=1 Tax=Nocardioides sp. TF02-7 TaxID=2917724 RepID=UPI001F05BCB4|nr:hypothetical protein [Nocardioides sp. TF02-7]UMG93688.1 hypothetical protein MF408_05775 [Nocardioides sp. TF02-7]
MTAPHALDLEAPQKWRPAPMPGANLPLDLVRLASPWNRFTIHGRFPRRLRAPGTRRLPRRRGVPRAGRGARDRRRDLPARRPHRHPRWPRPHRHAVAGRLPRPRLVRRPSRLPPGLGAATGRRPGPVGARRRDGRAAPPSPLAQWSRGTVPDGAGSVEVVSADLRRWAREPEAAPLPDDLVRRERP